MNSSTRSLRKRLMKIEAARMSRTGVLILRYETVEGDEREPDAIWVDDELLRRAEGENGREFIERLQREKARATGARVCLLLCPTDCEV